MNGQLSIPAIEVTTEHSIIINIHDTWMATRYGLRRNMGREKTWKSKTYGRQSSKHSNEHYFSLGDLDDNDVVKSFLEFLGKHGAEFQVILP